MQIPRHEEEEQDAGEQRGDVEGRRRQGGGENEVGGLQRLDEDEGQATRFFAAGRDGEVVGGGHGGPGEAEVGTLAGERVARLSGRGVVVDCDDCHFHGDECGGEFGR